MLNLDKTLLSQSRAKSVDVEDGRLSYEVAGQGPAVLALTSIGDTRQQYDRLAPALLEAGYQVILTDLRGLGQSAGRFKDFSKERCAADIKAILDAEDIKEAFLIVCSASGASGGLFAIEHPQRVLGLLMFNPIVHTGSKLMVRIMSSLLQIPGLGRAAWLNYFKSLYPARPVEADYFERVKAESKRPGVMGSIAGMIAGPNLEERVAEIKVPALIYIGSKDPDFKDPRAEAALLQQQMPHAQLKVLEGFGHYPQRECPEQVLPDILEWLKSNVRSRITSLS